MSSRHLHSQLRQHARHEARARAGAAAEAEARNHQHPWDARNATTHGTPGAHDAPTAPLAHAPAGVDHKKGSSVAPHAPRAHATASAAAARISFRAAIAAGIAGPNQTIYNKCILESIEVGIERRDSNLRNAVTDRLTPG